MMNKSRLERLQSLPVRFSRLGIGADLVALSIIVACGLDQLDMQVGL